MTTGYVEPLRVLVRLTLLDSTSREVDVEVPADTTEHQMSDVACAQALDNLSEEDAAQVLQTDMVRVLTDDDAAVNRSDAGDDDDDDDDDASAFDDDDDDD